MKAIIFGVTGQDGSYLSELLLEKDYEVIGVKRRSSVNTDERIEHLKDNEDFHLVEGDIVDPSSVTSLVKKYQPDDIYNLAAQSHVKTSFEQPHWTFQVNTMGVLNILEAIRQYSKDTRIYQASTSEMFGVSSKPAYRRVEIAGVSTIEQEGHIQDESTPFIPNSPYGVSKLASHYLVNHYRMAHKIFGSCGILFNHESERRGENFVTRKITKWIGEFENWRHQEFKTIAKLVEPENTICYGCPQFGPEFFPKLALGNLDI
jgi:GDPmannose 4,6-dehydratase